MRTFKPLEDLVVLAGLIVIMTISSLIDHRRDIKNKRENIKWCEAERSKGFSGVIGNAYLDDDINVKAFVIYLTNGQKFVTPIFLKSLNGYVEPGDSIFKVPGTFKFKIYKKQSGAVTVFEDTVNCNHW